MKGKTKMAEKQKKRSRKVKKEKRKSYIKINIELKFFDFLVNFSCFLNDIGVPDKVVKRLLQGMIIIVFMTVFMVLCATLVYLIKM